MIPELTTSDSEFDTHFDFLNTPNGVVNLKTGELLAHNPEYKFTKITRTEYHPEAKSEKFETFLNKITNNNSELIEYLQRIMGYALTGSTKEQIFFIFCGDGANGKSTFFNLFKSVLGLYAQSTPAQTLLATKGSVINADEARLQGARFVVAVEVNDRQKFDEAKVKRLTGSDGIVARFLRQNFFEFKPEFKLFIAVNNLPMVTPNKAIFRRIQVIPFNAKFDDDLNKDMEEELLMDSQAILAWAVEGARKWYSEGLCVCNAVNNATEGYRKSADVVQRFLSEDQIIKQGTGRRIPVGELYDTYKAWATENGEECIQKNQFGNLIKLKGFEGTKSGSIRYWQGLDLKYR